MANRPGQSITITGEAVKKALAEKRSLKDLKYGDTRIALLTDIPEEIDVKVHQVMGPWECEPRYKYGGKLSVKFVELEAVNRYDLLAGDTVIAEAYVGDRPDDLLYLDFPSAGVTATRKSMDIVGNQVDKPLVPSDALSGISDPKLGEVAAVLGWDARNTKQGE